MASSNKNVVGCENCESNPRSATLWCEKCDSSFCTDCSDKVHEHKVFSGHQPLLIDQQPLPPVLCDRHMKEELKYWCEKDKKPLCRYCHDTDHKAHEVETIENASKSRENEIIDEKEKIQSSLNSTLENKGSFKSNCESARDCIKETFEILRNALNQKENELLEKINAIEEKNTNYDEYNNQVQTIKARLEQVSKDFDALLSPRNNVAILQQFGSFKDKFDQIHVDLENLAKPSLVKCFFAGLYEYKTAVDKQLAVLECKETSPGEFDLETSKKLSCKGRRCARCGKCRDWYFIGDKQIWNWVQGWENWKDEDWNRYRYDRIYEHWQKREDGATCHRGYYALAADALDALDALDDADDDDDPRRPLPPYPPTPLPYPGPPPRPGPRPGPRRVLRGGHRPGYRLNCVCPDNYRS